MVSQDSLWNIVLYALTLSLPASLEGQLQQERNKSAEQVRAQERKLKELQDVLFQKMQEVNAGKDAQISLRAEIEVCKYRSLTFTKVSHSSQNNYRHRLTSSGLALQNSLVHLDLNNLMF